MTPFQWHQPGTLAEATNLLSAEGSHVISGGQSLLLELKDRRVRPASLVSIRALEELRRLSSMPGGGLSIGGAVTYAKLMLADLSGWQVELARVAGDLADRAVRTMGTVGGALCQAETRYDMPVLLVAAGAEVTLVSSNGSRSLPLREFYRPTGGTVIERGEILTLVTVPALASLTGLALEKFRFRMFDAALVSVCCAVRLDDDGLIAGARLVIGGVGREPVVSAVATGLIGQRPDALSLPRVARTLSEEVLPGAQLTTRHRQAQAELLCTLTEAAIRRACRLPQAEFAS